MPRSQKSILPPKQQMEPTNTEYHNLLSPTITKTATRTCWIQFENENPWERAVWLFKNVEGDHFERVTDPFIPEFGKPLFPNAPAAYPSGDFNNDGWPDIVSTGWGDGNEELGINGGGQVHFTVI